MATRRISPEPANADHSGTTPETSRITLDTSRGTNEDDSHCDPHPEASTSQVRTHEVLTQMRSLTERAVYV